MLVFLKDHPTTLTQFCPLIGAKRRHFLLFLVSALILLTGACTPRPSVFRSMQPGWHDGIVIGSARRLEAPAFGQADNTGLIAWASADQIYTRVVTAQYALLDKTPLLAGQTPWNLMLIPALPNEWHLLWQDLDSFGQPQIFAAHLQQDGALLRGPIMITSDGASSIAAAPGGGGSVVVLWEDTSPRPTLFGQVLDAQSRPSAEPPTTIAHNAAHPEISRTADGTWVTAWLALPDAPNSPSNTRTVMLCTARAGLPWALSDPPISAGTLVLAGPAEYIEQTSLGLDAAHVYLFVSLRSARDRSGRTDAFILPLDSAHQQPVSPLRGMRLPINVPDSGAAFSTGLNTGPAFAVLPGTADAPVMQPAAGQGQHAVLPVAVTAEGRLYIAYFQNGELAAYQPIAQPNTPGGLSLYVDRDRHLTAIWMLLPDDASALAEIILNSTRHWTAPSTD